MSNFCSDQGRTRVFGEAYFLYAAAGNPRRTQIRAKRAIYGWKLVNRGRHTFTIKAAPRKTKFTPQLNKKDTIGRGKLRFYRPAENALALLNYRNGEQRAIHLGEL